MNHLAGRRGRIQPSNSSNEDEDEKINPEKEQDAHSQHSSEEENDYVNEGSASGPEKILEDDIKYYLDRVASIADANPRTIRILSTYCLSQTYEEFFSQTNDRINYLSYLIRGDIGT